MSGTKNALAYSTAVFNNAVFMCLPWLVPSSLVKYLWFSKEPTLEVLAAALPANIRLWWKVTGSENTLAYPVTELIKAVNTYDTGPWNSFFYFIKLESLGFQINSYDNLKAILWEGLAYHETDNDILKLLIVLLP
jgi:hypothetical protein